MTATASFLQPGWYVDSDHPAVIDFAQAAVEGAATDRDRVSRLFVAVRDGVRYDPYRLSKDPGDYRASTLVTAEAAWCVPKAVLLTAAARAIGIAARLGFADVRNHLSSPRLLAAMGTDLFVFHGYAELLVDGVWRKATPAFNRELCDRFGVRALEFDGTADALLHEFDGGGRRHMEYVRERGTYADLPFDEIMSTLSTTYGEVLFAAGEDDVFARPATGNGPGA